MKNLPTGYTSLLLPILIGCWIIGSLSSVVLADEQNLQDLQVFSEPDTARAGRMLDIYAVKSLGIYVWVERHPAWLRELRYNGSLPIATLTSPPNTYPPASMSILTFPDADVTVKNLSDVASHAFEIGFEQFGVANELRGSTKKKEVRYGILKGYEIDFQAKVHGTDSDVKIFLGMREGKFPVLLQIYTLKGKMAHLSGQIRRTWTGIDYLD